MLDNVIDIQQDQKRSKNGTLGNTSFDLYHQEKLPSGMYSKDNYRTTYVNDSIVIHFCYQAPMPYPVECFTNVAKYHTDILAFAQGMTKCIVQVN